MPQRTLATGSLGRTQERSERGVRYHNVTSIEPLGRMPRLGVLNPE
jgi:hypothetical protein